MSYALASALVYGGAALVGLVAWLALRPNGGAE